MKFAEDALLNLNCTNILLNMIHPINKDHFVQTNVKNFYLKLG